MSRRVPFVVTNALGLHARPAAQLVELARTFAADLSIERDGQSANGKSLISVLKLGVTKDSEIVIEAAGPDEDEAADALTRLLASLAETETEGP